MLGTWFQIGNCFIFYTIMHFGPLAFATIATVRQLLSIIVSINTFQHDINALQYSRRAYQTVIKPLTLSTTGPLIVECRPVL